MVDNMIALADRDPDRRPSVDEALGLFCNVPLENDQQSRDFALAANELRKLKNLSFLRRVSPMFGNLESQLDEDHAMLA